MCALTRNAIANLFPVSGLILLNLAVRVSLKWPTPAACFLQVQPQQEGHQLICCDSFRTNMGSGDLQRRDLAGGLQNPGWL